MQCSVVDCSADQRARGLCMKHYQRWWKHGDANHRPYDGLRVDVAARIAANTQRIDTGCLIWTGYVNPAGYGQIHVRGIGTMLIHRAVWEIHHGPIPPSMDICHSCDNPPCVEDSHLSAAPHAQNMAEMAARGRSRPGFKNPEVLRRAIAARSA